MTNIKLKCVNSLDILHKIPNNYFDLCLTDPPYNLGKDYGPLVNDSLSHQEYLEFSKQWFTEAKRLAKGLIFTPGWNQLRMWLTEIEYPKGIAIWYNNNQMSDSNLGGWNHYEPLLVYGKVAMGKNVLNIPVSEQHIFKNTVHPNPKPVVLMEAILRTSTIGGKKIEKVIDPFVGVGTTAMACKKLNIRCVGYDINCEYIKEAEYYLNQPSSAWVIQKLKKITHSYLKDFNLYKKELKC